MERRRKPVVWGGVVVGILILISVGIVFLNRGSGTRVVRIGTFSTAIDYGPYFIAKSKGWFEESVKPDGAKVEYTTFQSLPPINESFATDRIDIVFEAEPPAIIGKAAGVGICIAGISCSLTQEVLVPAASQTKSIQDLKGKKVAVLAGTSSHYGLLKIARQGGLVPSDLTVLDMRPPDAKSAFRTGQVDAWAVWPPWVEQEIVDKTGRTLPGGEAQIQSIVAVREAFGKNSPALLNKVVGVVDRAKKWMIENPKEAQSIVAKELGLPEIVVAEAWPKHKWAATLDPPVLADIQAKADFLKEQNLIRGSVNVERDLLCRFGEK